ncbi:MAG: hypothetical protein F4047_03965 [Caldilineaceae bacterium SB0670_bin_27]|uniref:Essential protein Yae1 N-terminal domain-containing protein n=1 Tax=Caldilineaceae bacterium SB0664_bin_27 TaxID=2605260 RepID=A0A6B0YY78_9CHLR|nr:hypothetical protein [Caldilineaceae bacterium SB0664_bin_27]MYJ77312.1 hypothetical protein [Caldilineaceae bacterium SB0670_bin_27]
MVTAADQAGFHGHDATGRRAGAHGLAAGILPQDTPMIAKSEQYALGEEKGYQEGKQVGYHEGRKKGREEGREELLTQGDEAFVRKLREEKSAAYERGYEAGRREGDALEYERGRKEGWKEGLMEGYTRYHDSRSKNRGRKRAANRKQDAGQLKLELE